MENQGMFHYYKNNEINPSQCIMETNEGGISFEK